MNSSVSNWKSPATGLYGPVVRAIFLWMLLVVVAISWLVWLSGWTKQKDAPIIRLYVASSVSDVLEEAITEFNQQNQTQLMIVRVGGTGELAGQVLLEHQQRVVNGADLLVTADSDYLQALVQESAVAKQIDVAKQTLVIAVPEDQSRELMLDRLINSPLRLGITLESAAAGRLTRQAAKRSGITRQQLESAVTLQSENVVTLGQLLVLGQLDAAIVWKSVVVGINQRKPKQRLAIAGYLDPDSSGTVTCSVVADAQEQEVINRFLDFIQSESLSAAWEDAGFQPINGAGQ